MSKTMPAILYIDKTMVEVFKTNVEDPGESVRVIQLLAPHFPKGSINFDLEDCDRILRIEDDKVSCTLVIGLLKDCGYACEVLPD
jgi:hypothetical protein